MIKNTLIKPVFKANKNKGILPNDYNESCNKSKFIYQYKDSKNDLLFEFNSLLSEYSKEELLYNLLLKNLKSNDIFNNKSNLDLCDKLKKLELNYGYNLLIEVLYDLIFNTKKIKNENIKLLNKKRIQKPNDIVINNKENNTIFRITKINNEKEEKEKENKNIINKPKINNIYEKNNNIIPLCEKDPNIVDDISYNDKKINLEMIKKPIFVVRK